MLALKLAVLAVSAVGSDVRLLDFGADWCGPCRQARPIVQQLKAEGYPIDEVNIDQQADLAAKYNVREVPTFVLLVDGQEVDRQVGFTGERRLRQMLAGAIARRRGPVAAVAAEVAERLPHRPRLFPGRRSATPLAAPDKFREVQPSLEEAPRVEAPEASNLNDAVVEASPPDVSLTPPDAAPASSSPDAPIAPRILASSARLKIEDDRGHSWGSGTVIDSQGGTALILTCGHVFRESNGQGRITVDLFGPNAPQGVPGKVVSFDLERDIALVSIEPGRPVIAARVAPVGYVLHPGDEVVTVGCSNGNNPTGIRSSVASLDKYLPPPNVQVKGQPVQGRSGGGLFTPDGLVVGVCNAADPQDDEGLYAALASIHEHIDRAKLSHVYERQPGLPQARPQALAIQVPAMPDAMPRPDTTSVPTQAGPLPAVRTDVVLSAEEQAALENLQTEGEGAEVICIIRSMKDPQAKSQIIVLNDVSNGFLERLAAAQRNASGAHPTSARVPARTPVRNVPASAIRSAPQRGTRASLPAPAGVGTWMPRWSAPSGSR